MTHCRNVIPYILVFFWLAMTSCVVQTKTPDLTSEKLSIDEQDKRAGEALREASRLLESRSRKQNLMKVENLYLNVINAYQESRLMPEFYVRLISLYLTDYDPPAFGKAEALRNRYLERYPAATMKRTIDEMLAHKYVAHAEWEKLRMLYLPAIRRFIEAWSMVQPFDILMYSEAKFNLGDHEEARKGYTIVIKFFPDSDERKIAQTRIDTMHAKAAEMPAVRRAQLPSEQMMADRTAPPAPPPPPPPAKDTWKEVVSQNGDRSWIAVGPGTPPKEPIRQEDPSVFTGKDEQSHYEQIMPAVVAPPAIQPPPENLEEKVHMKDNGQSVRSIASGVPPDRVLNQQHLPARKNSEKLAPAAQKKPAVILPAAPLPIKQTEEGVSLQGKGQSRISSDLRTLPQQPLAQREIPLLTEEAGPWYAVQVGFFKDEKNALALADKLKRKGYDAHLKKHVRDDQKVFVRVLVGHFNEEKSAVEHAGTIRRKEELNAIIFVQGK